MNTSFSQAMSVQGRAIWSLALREIQAMQGKLRIGYLWQLIKVALGIGIFWAVRALLRAAKSPGGMHLALFILLGIVAWFIFSEIVRRSLSIVPSNRALLTFPQITPLDMYLSHALVAWGTHIIVAAIFLLAFTLVNIPFHIYDPVTVLVASLGLGAFSLGLGLVIGSLVPYVPMLGEIVPMLLRIMFFTSGIFFSPRYFPGIGELLMWNPLANFIELIRGAFLFQHPEDHIKIGYITVLTFVFLALGLLLERHARPRQETA